LIGEGFRDLLFGQPPNLLQTPRQCNAIRFPEEEEVEVLFGFICLVIPELFYQKWPFPVNEWRKILTQALVAFTVIVLSTVPNSCLKLS